MKKRKKIKDTKFDFQCRVCGQAFFKKPVLQFKKMPAIAQNLPDAGSLKNDKGIDLDIYQCSGCGLVQLACPPVPYYREVIRAAGFSSEMKNFRLRQFKRFIKKYLLRNKKGIEIGCGRGEYLSLIKQSGMKTLGLEYGSSLMKECRKMGLDVEKGFIDKENYKISGAPFDAFFMFSFLEHLPDPNEVLAGISNNLSPNAMGIIEVPNFDMILKKKLFSEFMRDHLMYFTKKTIALALEKNGFEVVECNSIWHDYIISAIVRKKDKTDFALFLSQQKEIKKQVYRFISRFKKRKVAVWGAGHQAFAVLSLLNLGGKIRYIVDSAPFKQGRIAPVTHIPIFSPEKLGEDPVEGIIIMAGSYSDEIKKIIAKKYGFKIKIAVLGESKLES